MSLGNCAAVAWEQPSASASTSDTAVFNNTSAVTALVNTTQTQTTTYTTTDHLSYQAVTPPSSLTTSSTFVWGKAAPTLRGFSGDNGPGGPSEQHLKFELSATSDTPANITATSGTQSLHYQAQTAVQLLIVSAGMIWIVL